MCFSLEWLEHLLILAVVIVAIVAILQAIVNKAVAKIIREGRKNGIFLSSGSDKIVAAGILGMCNWSHRWYKPDGRMNAKQIASVFADMVLSGLCPGATNSPKSAQ